MALSLNNRTLILLALVSVVAAMVLLVWPRHSSALPDYAAKTGQVCGTCHVNPAGGGTRTDKGKAFEAIPTHLTDPAGAWAQVSGAAAPAATATSAPAAATATRAPAATTPAPAASPTAAAPLPRTGDEIPVGYIALGIVVLLSAGWGIRLLARARR